MKLYTNDAQQAVAEFHHAFGLPDLIESPGPLPLERVDLRLALIEEEGNVELMRATVSGDDIEIIDALIDTRYVALGALVEMGVPLREATDTFKYSRDLLTAAMQFRIRLQPHMSRLRSAFAYEQETAADLLSDIAHEASDAIQASGLRAEPFFKEIHRSNMSKLGADGRPIRSRGEAVDGYPEGKVLKGPNYRPPNLSVLLERERMEYSSP